MTGTDTDTIADVIVTAVKAANGQMANDMAGMAARLATMEANHASMITSMAAMDTRMGACEQDVSACHSRIVTLESQMAAMGKSLDESDLAAQCEELTRKAFSALPAATPTRRMQKRVIRDGDGRIERVVEEPVGP
jgi:hypothetical protein